MTDPKTIIVRRKEILPEASATPSRLICFSHLRWDFVYQRPQHLLSRFAKTTEVIYFEEPIFGDATAKPELRTRREGAVTVAVPYLPEGMQHTEVLAAQRTMVNALVASVPLSDTALWYYTPMALSFSAHLRPALTVYDCMDELAAFKFAPAELLDLEENLFSRADVVFTGGRSLYRAKRDRHPNVHGFPSSIERTHFAQARAEQPDPADQAPIAGPRLGFYGVIDERFDLELIRGAAAARPDWQFVLLGPVVKIDPATLPQGPNIHYLGGKNYSELPAYLSGWDVALIPFALNESTRFISPTKTPEYLAAGVPVVSTPIADVVHPYGREGLVRIAGDWEELVPMVEDILATTPEEKAAWLAEVDLFLADNSWDLTQKKMAQQMALALQSKRRVQPSAYAKVA